MAKDKQRTTGAVAGADIGANSNPERLALRKSFSRIIEKNGDPRLAKVMGKAQPKTIIPPEPRGLDEVKFK